MTNFFRFCFDKWWRPVIFWVAACLTFGLSGIWRDHIFGVFAAVIFGLGLLVLLTSAIYQFVKRKWLTGLLNLGLFCATVCVVIFYAILIFFIAQEQPDTFADNLKIPANIPINIPINLDVNERRPDSITKRQVTGTDFQLYNSFQPGLYEYDFWTNNIESGTIYLKVFEITQEYALSTDRLPASSSVKVYNPSGTIQKFGTASHFTIYEGDWGKPYAARFEVWFRPENGGQERKLFAKNYKIEGWMR